MKLKDILSIIEQTAKENNLSKPFIVGGLPRDIVLSRTDKIKDIDITCGDNSSIILPSKVASKLPGAKLIKFNDGHSKILYKNFSIDFSSNFKVPNIDKILTKYTKHQLPILKELYSRDFTINTLLIPLDMSKIIDYTGKGLKDIRNKIIDTCLDPEITLRSDPKRIIRIIYLCAKLNFKPSKRVFAWIKKNGNIVSQVNSIYSSERINKALMYNKNLTLKLLKYMNLYNYIPKTLLLQKMILGVEND